MNAHHNRYYLRSYIDAIIIVWLSQHFHTVFCDRCVSIFRNCSFLSWASALWRRLPLKLSPLHRPAWLRASSNPFIVSHTNQSIRVRSRAPSRAITKLTRTLSWSACSPTSPVRPLSRPSSRNSRPSTSACGLCASATCALPNIPSLVRYPQSAITITSYSLQDSLEDY